VATKAAAEIVVAVVEIAAVAVVAGTRIITPVV